MEHIQQFDWYYSTKDTEHFLTEKDLDNSCTEKILRNRFFDPLLSSESEDEEIKSKIDWDKVFCNRQGGENVHRTYVPALKPLPPYPKLSALSAQQQYMMLKVICAQNPDVLESDFIQRPMKNDHRIFEDLKHIYLKEQQEFKVWAKSMWTSTHCIRALRPKPLVETVYEAEFKMKMAEFECWPQNYEMAAQIPLEASSGTYDIVHKKDLINVSPSSLPAAKVPELFTHKVSLLKPCPLPQPCVKHPCRFVLPNESSVSVLPMTEVHKELAQYAADHDAQYIASENALRCLMETERPSMIPISVCSVIGADGDRQNITVIGNEFSIQRQSSQTRTYRAFKHLLLHTIIPAAEQARIVNSWKVKEKTPLQACRSKPSTETMELSDDDDDNDNLFIDIGKSGSDSEPTESEKRESKMKVEPSPTKKQETEAKSEPTAKKVLGSFKCTCESTCYERPPPRSYRHWQVRAHSPADSFDLIVHCSHTLKHEDRDVVLEPIPEYQLELGATEQSAHKLRSIALALTLRRNATLLNVRVDGVTGDLVRCEERSETDSMLTEQRTRAAAILHGTLAQLQGLLPNHYVLRHEVDHGMNSLLYVARRARPGADSLAVRLELTPTTDVDEALLLKSPPDLCGVLLPMHKFRKTLPLAFTPFSNQVVREAPKKPAGRQKTPPQALKWPKRKNKKRKQNN